jgi:hypothetical protein
LADQAVDALLKTAALGVEIVFQRGREPVVDERGVFAEAGFEGMQHMVGLAADLLAVHLPPRLPQGQYADPQRAQGISFAVVTFDVLTKLGNRVGVFDCELEDEPIRKFGGGPTKSGFGGIKRKLIGHKVPS